MTMFSLSKPGRNRRAAGLADLTPRPSRLSSPGQPLAAVQAKCSCGGGCPACAAKGDSFEREADDAADQVMRKAAPPPLSATQEQPMKAENPDTGPADALPGGLRPPLTGGRHLPPELDRFFSAAFGHDFRHVRLHDTAEAAQSARDIGARAYAFGRHIAFAKGEYAPHSHAGRHLLAHELAHVVQQGAAPATGRAGQSVRGRPAHTIQQGRSGPLVQRAPDDAAAAQRASVDAAIKTFADGATAAQDASIALDKATFDTNLDAWLRTVLAREQTIDTALGGDATLKSNLRAAYIAAIRALVTRMAAAGTNTEADLYRVNSGRIPMWAWPVPHHLEPGISTPVPENVTADATTGEAGFTVNGVAIRILPDVTDPALKTGAETTIVVKGKTPYAKTLTVGGETKVSSLKKTPPPVATIRTTYGPGAAAGDGSAYGRGRTAEDLAGAARLPRSATLGFHEGEHARAFLEFIAAHPPPKFTGKAGMTMVQLDAAKAAYGAALIAYQNDILAYSAKVVDCVGTVTIDVDRASKAEPGTKPALICTP